jgi:hypothetical protein
MGKFHEMTKQSLRDSAARARETHTMTNETWLSMETAPLDGTEVDVYLPAMVVPAFWCKDQRRWVLSRPLHRDYADTALGWQYRDGEEQDSGERK